MKPIGIMMDEELLATLDEGTEVKRDRRSAVLRRIVSDDLRRKQSHAIDDECRHGYGKSSRLGRGWEGWEGQGAGPED